MRRPCFVVVALLLVGCGSDPSDSTSGGGGPQGGGGTAGSTGPGAGGQGGQGEGGQLQGGGGQGGEACVDALPVDAEAPASLALTGLYADVAQKTLGPGIGVFAPRFPLWSDAAVKTRWVYLPECGVIDSSDMNDWRLPVGTRLFKEFVVAGKRIETRFIERIGEGPNDFLYAAYLWNDAETEATLLLEGLLDAKGTDHDIPAEAACRRCHGSHEKGGGRPSRGLGLSAYQLSESAGEVTLASLAAAGKLSHAPPSGGYPAIGADAAEQEALGYLHANCGSCHNATVDGVPQLGMNLWIDVEATTAAETGTFLTAVGVPTTLFMQPGVSLRIAPGDPTASAVWFRMHERGNNAQMPPLGSEVVDAAGVAAIEAWIGGLP